MAGDGSRDVPRSDARALCEDIVDALTGWHEDCRTTSRVLGMPCVKRSGRVVFGLSRTGMVSVGPRLARPRLARLRLARPRLARRRLARPGRGKPRPSIGPAAHARTLAVPGAHLFDPSGRGEAFRPRVVVPPEQAATWEALAYDVILPSAGRTGPASTRAG
jgi:hypothetical protein